MSVRRIAPRWGFRRVDFGPQAWRPGLSNPAPLGPSNRLAQSLYSLGVEPRRQKLGGIVRSGRHTVADGVGNIISARKTHGDSRGQAIARTDRIDYGNARRRQRKQFAFRSDPDAFPALR